MHPQVILLQKKTHLLLFLFLKKIGARYVRYTDDAGTFKFVPPAGKDRIVNVSKNSAAFFAEIGYDFFITKYFAIGLQTSALIDLKNGKLTTPHNMSHIDVSLEFRFYNL